MPDQTVQPNSSSEEQAWLGHNQSFLNLEEQEEKPSLKQKLYSRFVNTFDNYGASMVKSPQLREPSCAGACISIIFKIIFLILLIVAILKLITDREVISSGSNVVFNLKKDGQQLQMDYPAMELQLKSSVLFFERSAPALQKIEIVDRSSVPGASSYTSSKKKVQRTIAVYREENIPLGSYDDRISQIPPKEGGETVIDLRKLIAERNSHRFLDESFRGIADIENDSQQEFFNHTVSAFLRVSPSTLKSIKSCQLQFGLVNSAEFSALEDKLRDTDVHKNLTSLLTTFETWNPSNFSSDTKKLDTPFNLLLMQSQYTTADFQQFRALNPHADVDSAEAISWNVFANYVPNFKVIADEIKCAGNEDFRIIVGASTSSIDTTGTTLSITRGYNFESSMPNYCTQTVSTPFQVYLANHVARELVTVTSVDNSNPTNCKITIERNDSPQNFSKSMKDPFTDYDFDYEAVPETWTCDPAQYFDSVCDCGCGAFDIYGCSANPKSPSCRGDEVCSRGAICVPEDVGYSYEELNTIAVSDSCSFIVMPGKPFVVGYLGDTAFVEEECKICPHDELYDGQGYLNPSTGELTCNFATSGTMLASEQKEADFFYNTTTWLFDNVVVGRDGFQYPYAPITVHTSIRFPQKDLVEDQNDDEKPYSVVFGKGSLGATQVDVIGAEPYDATNKVQKLYIRSPDSISFVSKFGKYLAQGTLVQNLNGNSRNVLVDPKIGTVDGTPFPFTASDLPYSIDISGKTYPVNAVKNISRPGGRSFQMLTLSTNPSVDENDAAVTLHHDGSACDCNDQISAGATSITVTYQRGKSYWSTVTSKSDFTSQTELVIADEASGRAEILTVGSITTSSSWDFSTCSPELYGAEDGVCDCNCGDVDPDCLIIGLSPADASSLVTQSCDTGKICDVNPGSGTKATCIATGAATGAFWTTASGSGDIPAPIKFTLNVNAVVYTYPVGSTVSMISSGAVSRVSTLDLSRTSATYKASDRASQTSVEKFSSSPSIPFEMAIFISPKREEFDSLNLCPNEAYKTDKFVSNSFKNWKFKEQGMLSVDCTHYEPFPFGDPRVDACRKYSEIDNIFKLGNCTVEMPVTRRMNFSAAMPVSDRYSSMNNNDGVTLSHLVEDPEINFDWEIVYHFQYDPDVEEVEKSFALGKTLGGDTTPHTENHRFFGALDYRGRGDGMYLGEEEQNSNYREGVPASVPLSSLVLSLGFNAALTQQLVEKRKPQYWPGGDLTEFLKEKFETNPIPFDLSSAVGDVSYDENDVQYIPLTPGVRYLLEAKIQITPKYNWLPWSLTGNLLFFLNPFIDQYSLTDWDLTINGVSVSKENIEGSDNNQSKIRFLISFDSQNQQLFTKRTQTISSVLSDVGSAIALAGVGLSILGLVQKIKAPPIVDLNLDRRKKAAKKRAKSMRKSRASMKIDSQQQAALPPTAVYRQDTGDVEMRSIVAPQVNNLLEPASAPVREPSNSDDEQEKEEDTPLQSVQQEDEKSDSSSSASDEETE